MYSCDGKVELSVILISCSHLILKAEGLGTLAALNDQRPLKRPYDWQVKQLLKFRFVPRHYGNVSTITGQSLKLLDVF